jgi:hypothetical protein
MQHSSAKRGILASSMMHGLRPCTVRQPFRPLTACVRLQVDLQWFWLVLYAAITVPFAPYVANPSRFFRWVEEEE